MTPIIKLFDKPSIIGVVADVNQGKSNLLYYLVRELKKAQAQIYSFGLRKECGTIELNSPAELEQIKDSVIIVDEFFSLYDLDNRKEKIQIENSLRKIHHRNNVLVLAGVGENFKKFISSKLNVIIYKEITFADLINGSAVKNRLFAYKGEAKGSYQLVLEKNEALVYDGKRYYKVNVPYIEDCDTKKKNVPIIKIGSEIENEHENNVLPISKISLTEAGIQGENVNIRGKRAKKLCAKLYSEKEGENKK